MNITEGSNIINMEVFYGSYQNSYTKYCQNRYQSCNFEKTVAKLVRTATAMLFTTTERLLQLDAQIMKDWKSEIYLVNIHWRNVLPADTSNIMPAMCSKDATPLGQFDLSKFMISRYFLQFGLTCFDYLQLSLQWKQQLPSHEYWKLCTFLYI